MKLSYSILLLTISVWIQYLIKTNNLILYVHPRYSFFTEISAIFSLCFSIVCIYIFREEIKNWNFKLFFTSLLTFGNLSLGILLLSILLVPKSLTSATASQRGVEKSLNTNRQSITLSSNPFLNIQTQNYEISDWLNIFSIETEIENYSGKEVKISGFAYFDEVLEEKSGEQYKFFKVARFVVTCCAVDARPVGIIVKYNNDDFVIQKDKWYQVSGKFQIDTQVDRFLPIVNAEAIEEIEIPSKPYIY